MTRNTFSWAVLFSLLTATFSGCTDRSFDIAPFDERVEVDIGTAPRLGPAEAPVTLVEFGDYQCPYCGDAHITVKEVQSFYGNKLRLVYKQFPLAMHQYSELASEAALAANSQGRFWAYHDELYAHQDQLEPADLIDHAKRLGLDAAKLEADLTARTYREAVQHDVAQGKAVGVQATPSFFINGRQALGALPFEMFQKLIDEEL